MESKMEDIFEETLKRSSQPRPEILWLQSKYRDFMKSHGITQKSEADSQIYLSLYGREPLKASDLTKIRFWRTGQHLPSSRQQLAQFGAALELNEEDQLYLLQVVSDRSDLIFSEADEKTPLYQSRISIINDLMQELIMKLYPALRIELRVSEEHPLRSLRHIYFHRALIYLSESGSLEANALERMDSISYGSELIRSLRLLGEIPRKTMIRHILIMCMPFINERVISETLVALGYTPLSEDHTLTSGEHYDYLLLQFLQSYQDACWNASIEECSQWLISHFRELDQFMLERNQSSLRPFYFRSIMK